MQRLDDDELRRWLREDAPHGDLTTRALGIGDAPARLTMAARGAMRVAATEEAARLVDLCGGTARPVLAIGGDAAARDLLVSSARTSRHRPT